MDARPGAGLPAPRRRPILRTALDLYGSPQRAWAALQKAAGIFRHHGITGLARAVAGKAARPNLPVADMVAAGAPPTLVQPEARWTLVGHGLAAQHSVAAIILTKGNGPFITRLLTGIAATVQEDARLQIVIVNNGAPLPPLPPIPFLVRVRLEHEPFNWSAYNNRAAADLDAEFLLFLNDDVLPLHGGWLDAMLAEALRPACGAVGAKLLYPDGRIQHAGIMLDWTSDPPVVHPYRLAPRGTTGTMGELVAPRIVPAVTGACLLTSTCLFTQNNAFDSRFAHNFNDVDYCLRLTTSNRHVRWTPFAELLHEETATRPLRPLSQEQVILRNKWAPNRVIRPNG
jgi:GT2 family glycosyltransferase